MSKYIVIVSCDEFVNGSGFSTQGSYAGIDDWDVECDNDYAAREYLEDFDMQDLYDGSNEEYLESETAKSDSDSQWRVKIGYRDNENNFVEVGNKTAWASDLAKQILNR